MGIFSRQPKPPEAQVDRITDANTPLPYRPGSVVRGRITFRSPIQRRVQVAQASFYGHCQTACTRSESTGSGSSSTRNTVYYKDDVDLFRLSQVFGQTFVAEAGQTYSWDYSFTFPKYSRNERGEVYRRDTACSPTYQVSPHDLPQSFKIHHYESRHAYVEYNVDAVFLFEDSAEPFIVKFPDLPYSPYPPETPPGYQPPFLEYVKQPEKYTSSRLTGAEKSMRNSFRDRFSSETPSLDVTMKASIVPVLSVGTAFALFVCVELDHLSNPQAINIPSVTLRVKSLELGQITTWRAMRVRPASSAVPEHETHMVDPLPLNTIPESRAVDLQLGQEKKQLIYPASFEARIPSNVFPGLRTVNINHAHRLRAVVEVTIAGKTFEHKFEVARIEMMPV